MEENVTRKDNTPSLSIFHDKNQRRSSQQMLFPLYMPRIDREVGDEEPARKHLCPRYEVVFIVIEVSVERVEVRCVCDIDRAELISVKHRCWLAD